MSDAPIICVVGRRGTGKTTKARELVADARRLLVHDPFAEHDALHLDYGPFCDYLDASPLDQYRVALIEGGAEEEFCATAWAIGETYEQRGDRDGFTVLLEEADLVAQPGRETPVFRRLCAQGRHYAIRLFACSRRPAEVSRLLTSQAAEFYVFQMQEPKDMTYLGGLLGKDVAGEAAELQMANVSAAGIQVEYIWSDVRTWEKRTETLPRGRASAGRATQSEKS